MEQTTELEALVRRAQSGDVPSLERLVASSQPRLLRLATRSCPPADTEDTVQEVLSRAATELGKLRAAGAFLAWLARMLVRHCMQLTRAAARFVSAREEEPQRTSGEQLRFDLIRALQQMDEASREVLLHRDILGETAKETAIALGLGEDCVKSRHRRARERLRNLGLSGKEE